MEKKIGVLGLVLMTLLAGAVPVKAGRSHFDDGKQVSSQDTYKYAQKVDDIYTARAIYGKLEGAIPVDLYSFKPSKDGEQTVSLRVPILGAESEDYRPLLILMDPTDATESQPIDLPLPSDEYHASLVNQPVESQTEDGDVNLRTVTEPFLLYQSYHVVAEQKLKFQKDKTYYLFVLDPNKQAVNYALQFGEGSNWAFKDVFTQFGSWARIQSNTYAGTSPFAFNSVAWSLVFFLLGLAVLLGTLIIQSYLFVSSNRSKPAAYLLVKLQPISRILIWVTLWFTALGGAMYFNSTGWAGLPFVIGLLFVPMLLNLLWLTLSLSFAVSKLEVSNREATVPAQLAKKMYANLAIIVLTVVPSYALLALFLSN